MTQNITRTWVVIGALLVLAMVDCAGRPTSQQLAAAEYGPYPKEYEQIIKASFAQALFDPYSAVYEFGAVSQGYWRELWIVHYGWTVCGTLNAKNRLGGYVGQRRSSC